MIITKANVSEYNVTGEFDIVASISPDADSTESKQVTLRFKLDNEPLVNIIGSSLKDKRINWQSTNRKNFGTISDKSIVKVDYKGGRPPAVDPETAMVNKLQAMSAEDAAKYLAELMAKAKK